MSPDAKLHASSRVAVTLIVAASILIPAILVTRIFLNFRHQYFLTHVDGAWLTCAHDFVHGVLYRPLFSSIGYGGTRYFPLYFVLTGLFSKAFGNLATAGLFLSCASIAILCASLFVLLRRFGASMLLSVAGVTSFLAISSTQQTLLSAKGDCLAAMLNFCGVLFCVKPRSGRASLYLSALLFTLAFATKITTVFGVAAVLATWVIARRYKDALQLAIATGSGCAGVLAAMYFASGGRVFGIFRACAAGGGSLSYTLEAPIHLILRAYNVDPIFLVFLVPALAFGLAAIFKPSPEEDRFVHIYVVLVALVTTVIFGSPGINVNHLLDLQVALVLMFVLAITRRPDLAEAGTLVLALALLLACVPTGQDFHGDFQRRSIPRDALEAIRHTPADGRPILAENPAVVLAAGKTPYLLDPFMFRILARTRPALAQDFWEKMKSRGFAAVILQNDPGTAEGRAWYTDTHFGGEFLEDLDANYMRSYSVGQLTVFTPK